MVLDIIAIVISVLGVFVSILVVRWQLMQDRRLNTLNLENEYFRQAFINCMLVDLPNARAHISITKKGDVIGKDLLKKELQNLMRKSLFYRYNDYVFYDSLCENIQILEDYLVNLMHSENKEHTYNEIDAYMEDIFQCLSNKYKGLQSNNDV